MSHSTTPFPQPILHVSHLRVELDNGHDVVSDVEFTLGPGEILGIVGESGSGKTTIAAALLGHVRHGARITAGKVVFEGTDILTLPPDKLRRIRGRRVGYVSQDPATALNPLLRIGALFDEVLLVHEPKSTPAQRRERILQTLGDVGLPQNPELLERFPHQLSGGQQQRVLLALAFLPNPHLIVLDEPTTALDVTTQAHVLATIRELCTKRQAAAVFISHDLSSVRYLVDQVLVLYAGRTVETAPRETLFGAPKHPYTRGLLDATPSDVRARHLRAIPGEPAAPGLRPNGCSFHPRCGRVQPTCAAAPPSLVPLGLRGGSTPRGSTHLVACYNPAPSSDVPTQPQRHWAADLATPAPRPLLTARALRAGYGARQVLFDVDLDLYRGECLALVGESGSGKTSLARVLAGLAEHAEGQLRFAAEDLPLPGSRRSVAAHRTLQYVFQNPYRALNPTKTVRQILTDAVRHFFPSTAAEAERRVLGALDRVALRAQCVDLYPRELSGGERQRIAIARALVCEPLVLICDEVTSSLDVSVQAAILKLLRQLQDGGLSLLFVTHDLGVVRTIADRVAVLHEGRIVETGSVAQVMLRPSAPYTRQLVQSSARLSA